MGKALLFRLILLGGLLVPAGGILRAPASRAGDQDASKQAEEVFRRAPDPKEVPGPDADLFVKGLAKQAKGHYKSARRIFWKLIDRYPDSPYACEAEDRSGANAFLGVKAMGQIGPSERRIDVALMGDGYTLEKQKRYDKHCEGELKVLLGEQLYAVYRPYFNFWQFNLASEDKGVDEPVPPPPDEELRERLRKRRRKKRRPKQYNTALDCKAAGPQGQVWANPRRVWHYLQYLPAHDGLVIVFAQMGRLGMGGMGIATTGPRGVVVHEFGHAFVGLLDEYAINPGEPRGQISAPNATTDREHPPWQHFLDAKVKGVGVYEGGATFKKGVWRPAPGCAMNSGGGSPYCPVCLEAGVLRIYERVSPIDQSWPEAPHVSVQLGRDELPEFAVLPMAPVGHTLKVKWILGEAPPVTGQPDAEAYDAEEDAEGLDPFERNLRRLRRLRQGQEKERRVPRSPLGFRLGLTRRARGTGGTPLPKGAVLKARKKKRKGVGVLSLPKLPALPVGRHTLTAVVWDPAKPKGSKRSWVIKDDRGLLEDRREWLIEVSEAPQPLPAGK